jgi:hypothetical protein
MRPDSTHIRVRGPDGRLDRLDHDGDVISLSETDQAPRPLVDPISLVSRRPLPGSEAAKIVPDTDLGRQVPDSAGASVVPDREDAKIQHGPTGANIMP